MAKGLRCCLLFLLVAVAWAQNGFEISFIQATSNSVIGGKPIQILVTMTGPAPRAGQLPVISNHPEVAQAYPIPFNAGQSQIQVVVPTRAVEKATQVVLSVGVYGNVRDVQITVEPDAPTVTGLRLPPRMTSGDNGSVTVLLDRPSPRPSRLALEGNENVTIGSLTIPANVRQFEAPFSTKVLRQGGRATLTYRGVRTVVGESQLVPPVEVAALQFEPAQVEGGQNVSGTVTLTSSAGAPARVKLSGPANLRMPAEVIVAEGSMSTRFTVVAASARGAQNCTIEAATPIARKTAVLTVTPTTSLAAGEAVQYWLMASTKEGFLNLTDASGKKWRIKTSGTPRLELEPCGYTATLSGVDEARTPVTVRMKVNGSKEDWKVSEVQVVPGL